MINEIILDQKLNQLSEKLRDYNRKSLTREIKLLFADLFADAGPNIFCYSNGIVNNDYTKIHGDKEFVFDMVVVEENDESNILSITEAYIVRTLLVLETELDDGFEEVIIDFQKLLISNADEKVIIFKCHSKEFEMNTMYLEECIKMYKQSNGKFHFIARLNDGGSFVWKTFQL